MTRTPNSLAISHDGKVVWERVVDKQPEVAKYYLAALQGDWRILFGNLQVRPVEKDAMSESVEALAA